MSDAKGLGRRAFLRSAGLTALAGAVVPRSAGAAPVASPGAEPPNGKYDFDS